MPALPSVRCKQGAALRHRCVLRAVAALLTAGCAMGPAPSPFVITTDASQYILPTAGLVVVHAVATNSGDQTLYLLPFEWNVQSRSANGSWQSGPDTSGVITGLTPVMAVAVGASVSDSVVIGAPGTYRMRLSYGTDSNHATARVAVSSSFTVNKP
jgi:hypothetical protein